MEENNKNDFKEESKLRSIFVNYGGGIIGGIISLVLCFTKIYTILLHIVLVLAGVVIGNYVQKNKDIVKIKLKELIDKV